jgi:hypothetical protein
MYTSRQQQEDAVAIKLLAGEVNLKYYGRFQAALQLDKRVRYVALLDNDSTLAVYSPCTHHALTMHSPCTHHALTMHSPCTHHALTIDT